MNFLWSWLLDYFIPSEKIFSNSGNIDKNRIIESLTLGGSEVSDIQPAYQWAKNIIPVCIEEIKPHPNAEHLRLCRIIHDQWIVCGAKNPREGLLTFFAPVGTLLPGEKKPLEEISLRGVKSAGMLCSFSELALEDDIPERLLEGIVDLQEISHIQSSLFCNKSLGEVIENFASHGTTQKTLYDLLNPFLKEDFLFSVDLTPNRGDLFSHIGMARELQGLGLGVLNENLDCKNYYCYEKQRFSEYSSLNVSSPVIQDNGCQHILLSSCSNDKNSTTPSWMKRRLGAIGLSNQDFPIDITNYIAQDLGQPMHVFSLEDLHGELFFTRSIQGETCLTLDHQEITLSPGTLVAKGGLNRSSEDNSYDLNQKNKESSGSNPYDLNQKNKEISGDNSYDFNQENEESSRHHEQDYSHPIVSLAGVMGAQKGSYTPSCDHILFEVAHFNPIDVSIAGQKHHITTASRQRFERGIDGKGLYAAMNKALDLYRGYYTFSKGQLTKKQHCSQHHDMNPVFVHEEGSETQRITISFNPDLVKTLGGATLSLEEIQKNLESLGAEVQKCHDKNHSHNIQHNSNESNYSQSIQYNGNESYDTIKNWIVIPPSWRTQWTTPEGCVEEILRLQGYTQCISKELPFSNILKQQKNSSTAFNSPINPFEVYKTPEFFDFEQNIRHVLKHQGFCEAITYSMIPEKEALLWGKALPNFFQENPINLMNPLSQDMSSLRPNLFFGLLSLLDYHKNYNLSLSPIMEFGPVFSGNQPMDQDHHLGFLIPMETKKNWDEEKERTFFSAKKMIEKAIKIIVHDGCFNELLFWKPIDSSEVFHHGQGAFLCSRTENKDEKIIGILAQFHPRLGKKAFGAEFSLTDLFSLKHKIKKFQGKTTFTEDISLYQPLIKDLSFFVPKNIHKNQENYDMVLQKWKNLDFVQDVVLKDIFEQDGQKSFTCSFFLHIEQGTTIDDIRELLKILRDIANNHHYILRGSL